MKLGLIVTNYNCKDLLYNFSLLWAEAKTEWDIKIVAIDGLFDGFDGDTQNSNDGSLEFLEEEAMLGCIDKFIKLAEPMKETDARNLALNWLKTQDVDYIYSTAPDELPTQEMLSKLFKYIEQDKFIVGYRLQFKNVTFTEKTYTDFAPFRIWKTKFSGYEIDSFYDDDGITYKGTITRDFKKDRDFPNLLVNKRLFHARHETWLNCERSKKKIEYQNKRWSPPNGFGCAFKWDDTKGLTWNENYFKLTGQPIPELQTDE